MTATHSQLCSRKGPKLAALLAYEANELSPEGRRRLERHVERCEVCSETRRSMKVYDSLARDVRRVEPALDTTGIELVLRREAKRISKQTRAIAVQPRSITYGTAGALAAAAAFVLGLAQLDTAPRTVTRTADPLASVEAASIEGEITAAGGNAYVRRTAGLFPARVGDAVQESDVLETRDGRLHARLADGAGVVLAPATAIRIDRLREGETQVALARGRLSNAVTPLEDGARYSVVAGDWRVEVKGTRFAVSKGDSGFGLELDEGKVELFHKDALVAVLEAPARFGVIADEAVEEPAALSRAASSWPIMRLPDIGATRWSVGALDVDAGVPLALRVAPGELTVAAYRDSLETFRSVVPVTGDFAFEPPAQAVNAPAPRVGELPPSVIQGVVQRGMPQFRRCQERTQTIGSFTLVATIGVTGEVVRARLNGANASPEFTACVIDQARRLVFPPPDHAGIVRFEVPLRFATRSDLRVP
jgi:ferric-dicitrate binding protein FerR (iron transport regulator)